METAPPEIHRTEVDGVPVFWTPVEGPRVASLGFRVGRTDEPAHQGGISHLVEHLALAPLTQQDYDHNGFVAPLRTVFHATGTDDELVAFLASVTRSLHDLPLDRILLERRILLQEAAGRSEGTPSLLRWYRYGFAGHGLTAAEEIGLGWLGPEPVAAWARERFTRANAVLWWSGPPPAGLRLPLPDGERHPPLEPAAIPGVTFPARVDLGGNGASLAFLGARSAATRILQDVLVRRLRQDLRFERGLVYDVDADYEPLDATTTHLALGVGTPRTDATEVTATILRELARIAAEGVTPEEIAREAADFRAYGTQPAGWLSFLDAAAFGELLGRTGESPAEVLGDFERTTPADTAAAAAEALTSMLLFAPPGPYDDHLAAYPAWSRDAVRGRTIKPTGWPIGPKARQDRLTIGPEGVTWIAPHGGYTTVRYDDCVALRHWDGPVRELWGRDGFRVTVDASAWRDGRKVVAEIDAALPDAIVACEEHGLGALATPPAGSGQATGTGGAG